MNFEFPQFEKPKEVLPETEPKTEKGEIPPKTYEQGLESREVMENFQEKRGGILREFLTSEAISNGLDLVPFAGGTKMLLESMGGETLGGKELKTGRDRLIHAGIAAASLGVDFTMLGAAGKGTILVGKSLPFMKSMGLKLLEKGATRSARIFEVTSKFMAEHPKLVEEAEKVAENQLKLAIERIKEYQKTNL